ncbi:MAG: cation-translocating P-type ATPase [Candidatus Bathyarchaeia archaeon]
MLRPKPWHAMEAEEVLKELNVNREGLTVEEASKRLVKYGYNELKERKRRTALQMFLSEFKNVFILLLIAATILSVIIGYYDLMRGQAKSFLEAYTDAITIGLIVVLVAIAGFVQEYRAEKALEALKKLAAPKARVLRDGKEMIIAAKDVVPGDILLVEAGDTIPADARIFEAIELKADEAVLTGESTPVKKSVAPVNEEAPVTDRKNMLFMGTHAVYGRGKAVVVSTGMNTEFGRIAELVQTAEEEETPLQKKLDRFAKQIAYIVLALCAIIFVLEVFAEGFVVKAFIDSFILSIALAISAVPEGLPAIVTISLALGAREFARRNALIRKLSSAESLGATTVICSDKTGTLTRGEMTVRRIYNGGRLIEVTGVGYEPEGEFYLSAQPINPQEDKDLSLLLMAGALCSNATLKNENGVWHVLGDPTEGALVAAAAKAGLEKDKLEKIYPRIWEGVFTSERKRMSTVHLAPNGERLAFVKGAPEIILERCTCILENGEEKKLSKAKKGEILEVNEKLAGDALRVLGVAYRRLPTTIKELDEDIVENDLIFLGLEGMIDPPREEAVEAYKKCEEAGIKVVMITGDHKLTAVAVAKEIGIMKEDSLVLTGAELDKMDDEEFERIVEDVAVYARVSPEHKLRIVKALKKKGHIVAMTGDGVNDAPAVKSADVGIAMGISGTDVTREASDIVLTDDNFATIVKAVEEGRVIYDNIRKYARFLIACNFDEVLVIGTFALLAGIAGARGEALFPLPLLPAMLLWINLVTDGAPAVSLALDPPDEDVMKRPPRKPDEGILHGMGAFIITSFVLQSTGTLLLFILNYYIFPAHPWGWPNGPINEEARLLTLNKARTMAFIQATMFELFEVWNCRSEKRSVWRMGRKALSNKWFVIAEIISIAPTLALPYIPITASMFHLVPLSLADLVQVIAVASWGLFFVLPEYLMGRKVLRWK